MIRHAFSMLLASLLTGVHSAQAQPVDARAASQAFNHLTNRMEVLERKMDMLVDGWDLMLGSAVVGFNAQRCPTGWTPFARSNALLVTGPDGSNQLLELKNIPSAELGGRSGEATGIPAQKLLFCVRAAPGRTGSGRPNQSGRPR
ncbi:MAG: hypothetical protein ACK4MX_08430 [Thermaurantiacus sp.]